MPTFTMQEFIDQHDLGVLVNDTTATKEIAKHLRKLGYRRVWARHGPEKRVRWVWTNETKDLEDLKKKLKEIKV